MEAHNRDLIVTEKPVRTFVVFDDVPCLIADKNDHEYKLITLAQNPEYFYVHKAALQELPRIAKIEKPTPYQVSRLCDPGDVVYILWNEYRPDGVHEIITFAHYISVNHACTKVTLLNEDKKGYVVNTKARSIKQVFYFKEI